MFVDVRHDFFLVRRCSHYRLPPPQSGANPESIGHTANMTESLINTISEITITITITTGDLVHRLQLDRRRIT